MKNFILISFMFVIILSISTHVKGQVQPDPTQGNDQATQTLEATTSESSKVRFKIEEISALALKHPFYRGVSEETRLLEKSKLYENIERCFELKAPQVLKNCYHSPSGGTGGKSLYFPTGIQENQNMRLALSEHLRQEKMIDPENDRFLNIFPGHDLYRAREIFNDMYSNVNCTSFPVGDSDNFDRFIYLSQYFSVNCLGGSPGRLMEFAQYLISKNKKLKMNKIWTACDSLTPARALTLQEAFGPTSFQSLLGSAETGVWGFAPSWLLEKEYSFIYDPTMVHIRILDPDENGIGQIVLTNLMRTQNPIYQYLTGDQGKLKTIEKNNKIYSVVEFHGRTSSSFQYANDVISLDKIKSTIEDSLTIKNKKAVNDFQLRIFTNRTDGKEYIQYILLAPSGIAPKELAYLKTSLPGDDFPGKIKIIVSRNELTTNPISRKVILVIDER
jgi:phenylacetate-CoA ligase